MSVLNFETYLNNVLKFYYSKIMKYRPGNHWLPAETGRWDDILLNVADEKTALQATLVMSISISLLVTFFKSDRELYLKQYFYVKPNICKLRELFTSNN